jgi:hypothetical protein
VGDFKSESKISDIQRLSKIDLSKMPTDDYFLENGDIVFVRSNGNRELVGRSIEIFPNKEKVVYSVFCIRYRIEDKSLKSTYVSHLFRVKSFRKAMLGSNRGANIQNINQRLLSELIIPIPPIELQKNFSIIVEKIESIKSRYQESLSEFENLYGSLSQKAFKGELDLSKILLPKEDEPGDKETKSIQIQAFQAKDEPENKTIKTIATIALAAGGVYLGPPEKTLCCHFTIPQSPGEMRLRSFSPNNHGQDENAKKILPNLFQVHHQHDNRNLRFTGLCQLGH